MRVNIYAEELLLDTEIISKVVEDNEFGKRTFYGLRFYLDSPPSLHHSKEDNDRSAVTLWIPWTRDKGYDLNLVRKLLGKLRIDLEEVERRIKNAEH